jgi:hypothetical protein
MLLYDKDDDDDDDDDDVLNLFTVCVPGRTLLTLHYSPTLPYMTKSFMFNIPIIMPCTALNDADVCKSQ